jgi:hypothetical protein
MILISDMKCLKEQQVDEHWAVTRFLGGVPDSLDIVASEKNIIIFNLSKILILESR